MSKEKKKNDVFIHPSAGRVLVKEDSFQYTGRITIPEPMKRRPTTGNILEVGEGVTAFQAGQKIVYGMYSGTVLTFKGWDPDTRINFRMLNQDEVLGFIDKNAPELEGVGV
jgi:co-chaperonin GroES (HSP10)